MNDEVRNREIQPNDAEVTDSPAQFGDLFKPQLVVLSPPPNEDLPPELPPTLLLVPKFENGNFDLKVSPQNWSIYNSTMNTIQETNGNNGSNGVSIVLVNGAGTVLALNGLNNAQFILPASGSWTTNVFPQPGSWQSSPLDIADPSTQTLWWTFLLTPGNARPEDIETVIFEFQSVGSLDTTYKSAQGFPAGWAAFLQFTVDGMAVKIISSDNRTFSLSGGAFSGALGQLVCNGSFTVESDGNGPGAIDGIQDGVDGGTWTGTSGGPLS